MICGTVAQPAQKGRVMADQNGGGFFNRAQFSARDVFAVVGFCAALLAFGWELRTSTQRIETRIDRLDTMGTAPATKALAELATLTARLDALEHDIRVLETETRKSQK
jgi:hypothetical protein